MGRPILCLCLTFVVLCGINAGKIRGSLNHIAETYNLPPRTEGGGLSNEIDRFVSRYTNKNGHVKEAVAAVASNLDPSEQLEQVIDEYLTWRITENPEYGSYIGIHDSDDKITQFSEATFVKLKNDAEALFAKITVIDYDQLTHQEKLHYKVLADFLQTFSEGFEFRQLSMYNMLGPLESPTNFWWEAFAFLNYNTEDDYRLYAFKRLQAIDAWVDQKLMLMGEAILGGTTVHITSLNGVYDSIDAEIVLNAEDSSVYKRFFDRTKPDQIAQNEWDQLKLDGAELVSNTYVPAWVRFKNYLNGTYEKNTRPEEGVWSLPNGAAFYQKCLDYYLTYTGESPENVHQLGLQEVDRISHLMEQEMAKYGHSGTLQEFIEVIKADQDNYYLTEQDKLAGYEEIIKNTRAGMQKYFTNMVETECRVQQETNPNAHGSYGSPGPNQPYGIFWANVFHPETKPKSNMPALTLHEAEPGHHTQFAYHWEKLTDMPEFRRTLWPYEFSASPFNWPTFSGFSEGWALYAESLGEGMHAYDTKYSLFGRYESELFRAARLVVDTGLHAKGWTWQQAVDYLGSHASDPLEVIEDEVNRYISWPGQACGYKIGQIKIESVRDDVIEKLGDLFDLREFHDQILKLGQVPMNVMEEFVHDWADELLRLQDNKEQLDQLFMDFLGWRFEDNPEYGTSYGYHQYDDMVSQWTEDAFIHSLEEATKLKQTARAISRDGLNEQDQLHLTVLEEHLDFFISGFAYRRYSTYNGLSPMEPPTDDWVNLFSSMRYNTVSNYQQAFTRMRKIATYVDQRIYLMNQSIADRMTLHQTSLTGIREKMQEEVVQVADQSAYYGVLFNREKPADITQQQWSDLESEASDIILTVTSPAWARFKQFLDDEYEPNCREYEGVWNLPGGIDYYRSCLRFHTTTTLSPGEVHNIGLQEVDRISKEMEQIMTDNGFSGTLQEYIAFLKTDPDNFYQTGDEMIAGYESIIADMNSQLSSILLHNPNMPLDVVKSTNPQSSMGSYSSPPPDGSRNGTFTANVFYPETKPKFDMPALTLHEAEPGHHTQFPLKQTYSLEQGLPLFRSIQEYTPYGSVPFGWPYYTGYVEGWALYAESLGIEMGAYDEKKWPHSLFGMYSSEIFRACRLVVDTGIHAFGWSKQDGIDFIKKYSTRSDSNIETELNRYISMPGQACGYKVGQLKVLELKAKATDALGSAFDLREFNDEVLKVGAAPLSLLEARINSWVSEKGSTTAPPTAGSASFPKPWAPVTIILLISLFKFNG